MAVLPDHLPDGRRSGGVYEGAPGQPRRLLPGVAGRLRVDGDQPLPDPGVRPAGSGRRRVPDRSARSRGAAVQGDVRLPAPEGAGAGALGEVPHAAATPPGRTGAAGPALLRLRGHLARRPRLADASYPPDDRDPRPRLQPLPRHGAGQIRALYPPQPQRPALHRARGGARLLGLGPPGDDHPSGPVPPPERGHLPQRTHLVPRPPRLPPDVHDPLSPGDRGRPGGPVLQRRRHPVEGVAGLGGAGHRRRLCRGPLGLGMAVRPQGPGTSRRRQGGRALPGHALPAQVPALGAGGRRHAAVRLGVVGGGPAGGRPRRRAGRVLQQAGDAGGPDAQDQRPHRPRGLRAGGDRGPARGPGVRRARTGLHGQPAAARPVEHCRPLSGDCRWRTVDWSGQTDINVADDTPVTLRFELRHADLFGFEWA